MILEDPDNVTTLGERVALYCFSFVATFALCAVVPLLVFPSIFLMPFCVVAILLVVPRVYRKLFDRLAASRSDERGA